MNASSSVFRHSLTLLLLLLLCQTSFSFTIYLHFCNKLPYYRANPIKISCGFSIGVHDPGHAAFTLRLSSNQCKQWTLQVPQGLPIGCSVYANRNRRKDPWMNPTILITDGRSVPHAGKGKQEHLPSYDQQGKYDHSPYDHQQGKYDRSPYDHQQGKHDHSPYDHQGRQDHSPYDHQQAEHDHSSNDDEQLPSYEEAINGGGQSHHTDDPPTYKQATNGGYSPYDSGNDQHLPPLQQEYMLTLTENGVNFKIHGQHDFMEPYQWPINYHVYIHNNCHSLKLTVSCKIDRKKVTQTINPGDRPMHLPLNMPPYTKRAVGCTVYWDQRKNRNAKKYYSFFAFDTTKVRGPIYYVPGQHKHTGIFTWHLQDDGIYQWSAAHGRNVKVVRWRENKSGLSRYSNKKRTKKPFKFRKRKTYRSSRWGGADGEVYQGNHKGQYYYP